MASTNSVLRMHRRLTEPTALLHMPERASVCALLVTAKLHVCSPAYGHAAYTWGRCMLTTGHSAQSPCKKSAGYMHRRSGSRHNALSPMF